VAYPAFQYSFCFFGEPLSGINTDFCNMYTLKKSLGQHFLKDDGVCRKIVELPEYSPGLNLVEVGPGGGAITKYLLAKPDINYLAIEIDTEKVEYLNKTLPAIRGKILTADILTAPLPFSEKFSVIGNFPYNISTQIMFRMLEWQPQVAEITGMFQKEVAERIAGGPGNKTYGILSVLMQTFFKVVYRFDVHENCFDPPPKVKSGVIQCYNLGNPWQIADTKTYFRIVKAAFNQRRKTLRNALRGTLPPQMLTASIMDKRAEQLSVADFVAIYNEYKQSALPNGR
jgi:16S rRNA (adenine1518-N6/adenine1519-N6)-dimethyltransferase